MWVRAGVIRSASGLKEMLDRLEELKSACQTVRVADAMDLRHCLELQHMLLVSEMVCRAALMRTESRGSHYRADFPEEDDANWLKNIVIEKKNDRMTLAAVPVALDLIAPK
jgi:succinate dehydrogenase/fumarate reductase flavoprotein subunit